MLKAYVYPDNEVLQVSGFTPEEYAHARVNLSACFTPTEHFNQADVFFFPLDLGHWEAYHGGTRDIYPRLQRLQWWLENEYRHVFYMCSDGADPMGIPSIVFRQSFWKDNKDVGTIAWPYSVEDFGDLVVGARGFASLTYDVSFVGSKVSHISRIESFDSVANTPGLKSFLDDSKMHWGSIENTEVGKKRKEIFIDSMRNSRMVLAARGGGLSCYRFFEAMSAGRVPVLFADDWELPHQDLIDWNRCIIKIPENKAREAGPFLLEQIKKGLNVRLADAGLYARAVWKAYLAPEVWPTMMEWYIRKRIK